MIASAALFVLSSSAIGAATTIGVDAPAAQGGADADAATVAPPADEPGAADAPPDAASSRKLLLFMMAAAVVSFALMSRFRLLNEKYLRGSVDLRDAPPASTLLGCAAGLWLVWALTAAALSPLAGSMHEDGSQLRRIAMVAVGAHGAAMIGAVVFIRFAFRRREATPFRARPIDALIGAAGLLLALPVVYLVGVGAHRLASMIAAARGEAAPDTLGHDVLLAMAASDMTVWTWIVVLDVVLLAPVVEEVIYRGFLQTTVVRAVRSPLLGIVLTSAVFAFVHAGSVPAYALATLFAASIGFGVVYERTGRIGAPIVMHAAFNALNIGLVMLTHSGAG